MENEMSIEYSGSDFIRKIYVIGKTLIIAWLIFFSPTYFMYFKSELKETHIQNLTVEKVVTAYNKAIKIKDDLAKSDENTIWIYRAFIAVLCNCVVYIGAIVNFLLTFFTAKWIEFTSLEWIFFILDCVMIYYCFYGLPKLLIESVTIAEGNMFFLLILLVVGIYLISYWIIIIYGLIKIGEGALQ